MIELRPLTAQDAGLVSHIHATCWRQMYRELIDPDYLSRLRDDYWVAPVAALLDAGSQSGALLKVDGVPAGCVCYGRGRDVAFGDWGEIVSLYLLPTFIGHGYGKLLLDYALATLRLDGYSRFYLWMIDGCRAEHFYARQGFHVSCEHTSYRIGSRMVRDIRLVRVEKPAKARKLTAKE